MDDVAVTVAICERLGEIPGWVWREGGPAYAKSDTGIFYGAVSDGPLMAVGVRVYASDDDLRNGLAQRTVQLRFRGEPRNPTSADRLASQAFDALHGLSRWRGINGISRRSMAPLGADTSDREERSDNYTVIIDNPEA